ncbi:MAG TPA: hypothetical protein PLL75_01460 [Candidatus Omnitrophota bacterium]|nr:hypothetical protein [Candidatus Omnitrophota bacterium]
MKNFRKIKVDTTSVETDEVRDVIGRFEVFGVPTVIFMDEKGREVPEIRMEGFVTAAEFLDVLRSSRLKRYLSPGKH